jgi:hypothetical protein
VRCSPHHPGDPPRHGQILRAGEHHRDASRPEPGHVRQRSMTPTRAPRARTAQSSGAVAVVSDGSGPRHQDRAEQPQPVHPVLADYATLIHHLTGLPAYPVTVPASGADQLAASLGRLAPDIGAIFLTTPTPTAHGPPSAHCKIVEGCLWSPTRTPPRSPSLRGLARDHRAPPFSRVVIAGAEHIPMPHRLLITAGVGYIISWNEAASCRPDRLRRHRKRCPRGDPRAAPPPPPPGKPHRARAILVKVCNCCILKAGACSVLGLRRDEGGSPA